MARKKKRTTASSNSSSNSPATGIDTPHPVALEPTPAAMSAGPEMPTAPNAFAETSSTEAWTEGDRRFWWVGLAVLVFGIALRQWNLGNFAYHPDEAIHAWYGNGFLTYNYDPIYHGPLLYHLLAVVYTIFGFFPYLIAKVSHVEGLRPVVQMGANDFTARLVPSLLGIGMLAMVFWPARRWLGARGALWCMALLAISPVMVSYQRRLLHDALVMVLTLGAVLCLQSALEHPSRSTPGRRARIGLVLLLTLFVATKANAFFIIGMLAAYWLLVVLQGWRRNWGDVVRVPAPVSLAAIPAFFLLLYLTISEAFKVAVISGFGSLSTTAPGLEARAELILHAVLLLSTALALWLVLQWRGLWHSPGGGRTSPAWLPCFLFLIVSIASYFALRDVPGREWMFTVICGLTILVLMEWLRRIPQDESDARHIAELSHDWQLRLFTWIRHFDWKTLFVSTAVAIFVFAFLYGHGYTWWRIPIEIGRDFDGGWQLLVTRAKEVIDALPRMLHYWGGQQKQPRLPGRHDYYLPLMILYELPIVIAAIGGIIHASRRRTPFTDLLLWWAFTSFVVYAIANEKVPWLLTHIMLPLTLLAGVWLGQIKLNDPAKRSAFAAAGVLGAVFLLRGVSATNFERPADRHEPMFYAQTTEAYHDALVSGLERTRSSSDMVWVHPDKQWPAAWYFREKSPMLGGSHAAWGTEPPPEALRMAVHLRDIDWQGKVTEGKTSVPNLRKLKERLANWQHKEVEYYIWTRASWPGLRPDRFWRFWLYREVDKGNPPPTKPGDIPENGILTGGESSIAWAVVSTPQ